MCFGVWVGKAEGRTGTCSVAVMFEVYLSWLHRMNDCLPALLHVVVVVVVDCGVRYVCECACVAFLTY